MVRAVRARCPPPRASFPRTPQTRAATVATVPLWEAQTPDVGTHGPAVREPQVVPGTRTPGGPQERQGRPTMT